MISIDPGIHPGFAWFDDESGEMWGCSHIFESQSIVDYDTIVCERPVIYRGSPVNPQHIITLAINAGQRTQKALESNPDAKIVWYEPRDWKGQIPKTKKLKDYIVLKNIRKVLNSYELQVLDEALGDVSEKEGFDVVDAVGIGLFHLKRI